MLGHVVGGIELFLRQRAAVERFGRHLDRREHLARRAGHAPVRDQRDALAQQVRAAYAMGRQERLRILLNQQDPATVSRMMVYYDYLNRARADRMREIRDLLFNPEQTGLMLDEAAGVVYESGRPSFVDADRAMPHFLLRLTGPAADHYSAELTASAKSFSI